mmetsp:Transcript_74918/g.231431  ORF Transcript_74918/g.231431 Transcript_74918/m.231431 type:complete len:628 (+) Transcript_74918:2-1885(+)
MHAPCLADLVASQLAGLAPPPYGCPARLANGRKCGAPILTRGHPHLEEALEQREQADAEAAAAAAAEEEAKAQAAKAEALARAEELDAAARAAGRPLWAPIPDDVWAVFPKLGDGGRPKKMNEFKAVVNDTDPGEYWGIRFPFTPQMLRDMGPEWLTQAMHTAGTLPRDNAVTRFTSFDVKAEDVTKQDADNARWGGAGLKILLRVEYKNGPGDLTEGMFIKMPHEFTGKNERYKNSVTSFGMDWSEVTFYNVFGGRFGHLPFKSPRMYFCDMCRRTTNFVNIVEQIPYAKTGTMTVRPGEYYPAPEKYRDWALPNNGLDLYYAHARALAQFFAWHRMARQNTDQIERIFMDEGTYGFKTHIYGVVGHTGKYNSKERDELIVQMLTKDPGLMGAAAGMGFSPQAAQGFLDLCLSFAGDVAKGAFPRDLVSAAAMEKFRSEAGDMAKYCCEMQFYMSAIPEFFSLCHPNAQVDNAFYWKDESGQTLCGLLDWGGVSHSTIPGCLGNGWIGAEPEVMEEHEEKLIQLFVDEYEKVTGFRFDPDDLRMNMKLAQCCVLYGCCANIGMLLRIYKKDEWKTMKGRKDPRIDENFLNRCYFVQIHLWLKMWQLRCSPYNFFQQWMKRIRFPPK